ncbi:MAG: tetratricopeptide repeat protein, partial [Thermomicrobiales bacterium]|nr:tetratricopeptide repeat protein [Thermomicrobiales bacterium]
FGLLNLMRGVFGWLRDRGATAAAMEMAASLGWFWTAPNYIAEGRAWFASLLEAAGDDIDPALRAKTLQSAGDLANWQNDSDDALSLLRQAAALWTLAGDESRVAECLRGLGSVAIDRGEFAEAVELLEDVVTRSRAAGNPWNAAASANLLGLALKEVGQLDAAVQCHEEALVGWQRSGSDDHLPVALNTLGLALMSASDVSRAAESFDAAISLAGEDEFTYEAALSIVGFAHVAASRDDSAAAVQLLASEASQRSQLALPLRPHIQLEVDQLADRLRSQLGNAAFAMHWSNGRSLSFAETIAIARSVNVTLASSDVDLSRREREVLRLLVEGASDNEIAEELFISRRTASKHVAAILEKLGSSNRTAAATAALRKGLV